MMRYTLIKHKEAIVVCEESGHVSLNYNDLLTTLEVNIVAKPLIVVVIAKSSLTCANYGKIGHTLETYHSRKERY